MKIMTLDSMECYTELLMDKIKLLIELNKNGKINCPNCGAIITSEKCPYCGTVFTKWYEKGAE